jgi:Prp8 binding protein
VLDPLGAVALLNSQMSLIKAQDKVNQVTVSSIEKSLIKPIKRVSNLFAPIMLLEGHKAEVFTLAFSPNGQTLASAGFDQDIYLWESFGACNNTQIIKGHTGAILQILFTRDNSAVFSVSTDKTCGLWDIETGARKKKWKSHSGIINTGDISKRGNEIFMSGGDDGAIFFWEERSKNPIKTLKTQYPVLCSSFSLDSLSCFTSGVENEILMWDLRADSLINKLSGHLDSVTGLKISPDGDSLLSYSMDDTLKIWDIKPFSTSGDTRLITTLPGAPHGYEKNLIRPCWSPDSDFVATGCGDRSVMVWNVENSRLCYKLPGHKGTVNQVDWSGNILASASSDRNLFLGELNLQEVR